MKEDTGSQLVSLRIPSGWCIEFNAFFAIEPIVADGLFLNASYFSEDLLSIERIVYENSKWPRFILDLGWYPAGDIDGHYRLVLASQVFSNRLQVYETKELLDVTRTLERWLSLLSVCSDEKEVSSLLSNT